MKKLISRTFLSVSAVLVYFISTVKFAYGAELENPLGSKTFLQLLEKIADGVGTVIASLGAIMIIVAGILYLTSAGSTERMGTAKKALIYAIAGIAIGLSAKAIVAVIKSVLGAE